MRKIDTIVIHCSATPAGRDVRKSDIDRMHKARGFGAGASTPCGYHYVIRIDGVVERGRREDEVGAHVAGHNARSIGVVYAGGIDQAGRSADTRTAAQLTALEEVVRDLRRRFPGARIAGHRDLSPDRNGDGKIDCREWLKDCPCFDVAAWVKECGL